MNRILFAAARGARIEVMCDTWEEDRCVMVWDIQHEQLDYRIRPDDEHLQYGPISSGLRSWAALESAAAEEYVSAMRVIADDYEADWCQLYDTEAHRSLFLLLLSEALADEGL